MKWLLLALWCLFFVLANVLAKRVSVELMAPMPAGEKIFHLLTLPQAWLTGLGYLGCAILYLWLLTFFPLSIIMPLCLGLGLLLVMGIGVFWEKEVVTRLQMVGALFCLIGVVLIKSVSD